MHMVPFIPYNAAMVFALVGYDTELRSTMLPAPIAKILVMAAAIISTTVPIL